MQDGVGRAAQRQRPFSNALLASAVLWAHIDWVRARMEQGQVRGQHIHTALYDREDSPSFLAEMNLTNGQPARWNYPNYRKGKARLSQRTGLPSGEAWRKHAHLMHKGDALYAGAYTQDGITASTSGWRSDEDAFLSQMLVAAFITLANKLALKASIRGLDFAGMPPDQQLTEGGGDLTPPDQYHSFLGPGDPPEDEPMFTLVQKDLASFPRETVFLHESGQGDTYTLALVFTEGGNTTVTIGQIIHQGTASRHRVGEVLTHQAGELFYLLDPSFP